MEKHVSALQDASADHTLGRVASHALYYDGEGMETCPRPRRKLVTSGDDHGLVFRFISAPGYRW
eukprot:CAMPEP_0115875680 /NCGR_PEP_ID=MMETSP0287-20121206/25232_1 /TAXON_ID=412157 /ORGANISM="Chrysochromulina rotalis, Strain UIO044" /LENGTH=63 /DNA_ID=CAMNT_0003330971 /DNA_START=200 /DNA_END=389 /DNA_ORIENTATION=-